MKKKKIYKSKNKKKLLRTNKRISKQKKAKSYYKKLRQMTRRSSCKIGLQILY